MRICYDSGNKLCAACSAELARPIDRVIPPCLLSAAALDALLPPHQRPLDLLVQHPVHGRLGHAEIAGAHALVEAPDPLVAQHLANAVQAVFIPALGGAAAFGRHVLVELQPGLDHPDWVGRCTGDDAGQGRRAEVHPGRVLAAVEMLGDEALAVAVGEEIDGAGGDDADQVRPQALEESPRPLLAVDGGEDGPRFLEVIRNGAERVH